MSFESSSFRVSLIIFERETGVKKILIYIDDLQALSQT